MIVGFSKYSKGNGNVAIDYLIDPNRTSERQINPPEVIKGDVQLTKSLINTLEFEHKYTSGVLSFAPNEKITPEMEKAIIERFEQVAFAGQSEDRYNVLWVRHQHAGHHELHFITPRIELETGKSFNIKQPGKATQAVYDDFRNEINARYGLASPDDPSRKRDLKLTDAELKLKLTEKNGNVKQIVNEILVNRTISGAIKNREDVLNSLKELGFSINRAGKNYITIKDPSTEEKFRLKGTLYEQDFNPSREIESATATGSRDYTKADENAAREYQQRVNQHIEKRTQYNAARYGKSNTQNIKDDLNPQCLTPLVSRNNVINRDSDRNNDIYNTTEQQSSDPFPRDSQLGNQQTEPRSTRSKIPSIEVQRRQKEPLVYSGRAKQDIWRQGRDVYDNQGVLNDRIREKSVADVREAFRGIEKESKNINYEIDGINAKLGEETPRNEEFTTTSQRIDHFISEIRKQFEILLARIREKNIKKAKQSLDSLTKRNTFEAKITTPEKIQTCQIDDKAFNRLIVMPAPQNDGFENVIRFKVAFKQDDKMVMQLKDLKEADLNRMGIDTKGIDMRKVEPVYIELANLKQHQIDSPFRHAEKSLESLNQSMRNRAMPKDELEALKTERATLEAHVEDAKQKQVIEQPQQEQKKPQQQEQDLGFSL
ncbi:MAG TPA: relaxase/mobilization nuclease domain-containing protein [Arsenophonus nasoniae]|uniref:relaxase/mobilization nuclease domain-containing protein n=1 Tax=Arsenophonus nasoniae TaxID=638 RepID=UPI003879F57F